MGAKDKPRAVTLPYQVPVVWSPQAAYAIQKDFETIVQALQAAGIGVALGGGGTVGPIGPRGLTGLTGLSGLDGFDGEYGADSLIPGPPGRVGPAGPSGGGGGSGMAAPVLMDGEPGEEGAMGLPGMTTSQTGAQGPQGNTGPGSLPGMDGLDGQDGQDSLIPGSPGVQGIQGPAGPAGTSMGAGVPMPFNPHDEQDVGDPEAYTQTLGPVNLIAMNTTVISSGGGLITSTFNPQGLLAANIGQIVGDAVHERMYVKLANQAAKTGWYPLLIPGASGGPIPWFHTLSGIQAIASGAIRGNGYGYFSPSVGDATDPFTPPTGITTSVEVYVSGKRYGSMASAATSGTNTYMALNNAANPRKILDDDIDIWVDMRTDPSAVTSVRYWFGLTSAVIVDTDTLGSTANGSIMFRFSTAAGDGGWVGATQLNGGANQTVTSTVNAIAAATNYRLRIRFVRSGTPTVYFSVNDGTETAVTTNIPATGNTYFPIFGLTAKANSARAILWRQFGASVGS